jgi:hypothetical protein
LRIVEEESMFRTLALAAALALAAGAASAEHLDANGKCRDSKGHFAKMEVCKAPASPPQKCLDAKGKFAMCRALGAAPVKK